MIREDAAALNPGEPIKAEQIPSLVRYVNGTDGRVTQERATYDAWERSVTGHGAALVKDIIIAYYAKHDSLNPQRPPISPGWIRAEAKSRVERAQNLKRLEAPREERRGGPPEHIAAKFAAYKAKYPRLLNKD